MPVSLRRSWGRGISVVAVHQDRWANGDRAVVVFFDGVICKAANAAMRQIDHPALLCFPVADSAFVEGGKVLDELSYLHLSRVRQTGGGFRRSAVCVITFEVIQFLAVQIHIPRTLVFNYFDHLFVGVCGFAVIK